MEDKTTTAITVRLPPELLAAIQAAARDDRRSVNSWIVVILERELKVAQSQNRS